MIQAFIYFNGNFARKVFRTRSVRDVMRLLSREYGRISNSMITATGDVVWSFRNGAKVSLAGDVKIKAGYRSLA